LWIYASELASDSSSCGTPCKGDANQICGGNDRLSVYKSNAGRPHTNLGTNGYGWLGCFADSVQYRTLKDIVTVDGEMTVEKCLSAASDKGYQLAGLEYGGGTFPLPFPFSQPIPLHPPF
jgi:hypothetical protein